MALDPFSWCAGAAVQKALDKLTTKDLRKVMRDEATAWGKERGVNPDTLFRVTYDEVPEDRPRLAALRKRLARGIPTANEWYLALHEQWECIAESGGVVDFYTKPLTPERVRDIRNLANRLAAVVQDFLAHVAFEAYQNTKEIGRFLRLSSREEHSVRRLVDDRLRWRRIDVWSVVSSGQDTPEDLSLPILLVGPPNVGKTCWSLRQAHMWVRQTEGEALIVDAATEQPETLEGLADEVGVEVRLLLIVDDVHFARKDLAAWLASLERIASNRTSETHVLWVSRDASIADQLVCERLRKPRILPIDTDRVVDLLTDRLEEFPSWQRWLAAFEVGLDPRFARHFPSLARIDATDPAAFRARVRELMKADRQDRLAEYERSLRVLDDRAFELYWTLLPLGATNLLVPLRILSRLGSWTPSTLLALVEMGLIAVRDDEFIVLTEHPFQAWANLGYLPEEDQEDLATRVFGEYFRKGEGVVQLIEAAALRAEWAGVREPLARGLGRLSKSPEWRVGQAAKAVATTAFEKLTRTSYPTDEARFLLVLGQQLADWEQRRVSAASSESLRAGDYRLDQILYELAYLYYVLEDYGKARSLFSASVDAGVELIRRASASDASPRAQMDGGFALANIWLAGALGRTAEMRAEISESLKSQGSAPPTTVNRVSGLAWELAELWRSLVEANKRCMDAFDVSHYEAVGLLSPSATLSEVGARIKLTPKMKEFLGRHENNCFMHALEASCWPKLFGIGGFVETGLPALSEREVVLGPPEEPVGLPKYRERYTELLVSWAQGARIEGAAARTVKAAVLYRAGGGFERLGDVVLLAWRCSEDAATRAALEWYLREAVPKVGTNGLAKRAVGVA